MSKVTTLKTKQDKVLEPKSVRLTQAHRQDMVNAVMAEWEAQNPAPALSNKVELLKLVAKEIKKHPLYKRTQRMVSVLEHDDLKALKVQSDINVDFVNKQGEIRRTERMYIPVELAESFGLNNLPEEFCSKDHTPYDSDIHDKDKIISYAHGVNDNKLSTGNFIRYTHFSVINPYYYFTVQLDDTSPAMQKMDQKRKLRMEWATERNKLREETIDLLQQFNTTKQLRDGWPEIVPYMPAHIADPTAAVKLPVLATSRLNQRLGIK